jgi:protein-disulfide isomerase
MIHTSRRTLMLSSAALAFAALVPAFAEDAKKIDLTDLMTPPEEGDMSVGLDTAKVTIIEYASASCPHCAAFYNDVYLKLKTDYIDNGKVKFIFREFPHNDQAMAAFMVARCSPKEKYFPLIDIYFKTQEKWVPDAFNQLKDIAQQTGMTAVDFEACLKNEGVAKKIWAVRDKADKSYGVTGIPTIFVNGKAFDGERTYAAMKAVLDPLLI